MGGPGTKRSILAASLAALALAAGLSAEGRDPDIVAAVRSGDAARVRALMRGRIDVNAAEPDGTTALHWAVRANDAQTAGLLIKAGARVNTVNRYGVTALSLAASNGDARLVALLIEAGADWKAADKALADAQTLLMFAARAGNPELVRLLIRQGAAVNARETRTGTTPLIWAAIDDRADAVHALIEAGAEIDVRSKASEYPHTPLKVTDAVLEEDVSYVGQTVLAKGEWTPLMYAARQGSLRTARMLAEAGADLNATDPDGTSALLFAVINGHYDLAAMLVDKGANPNLGDRAGMTPLYAAVDLRNLPPSFGRPNPSPVVVAAGLDAMKMLLAHGADPNARLKTPTLKRGYTAGDRQLNEGATPLMRAARGADLEAMRILLEHGAETAAAQKNGNTALFLAAGNRRGTSAAGDDESVEGGSTASRPAAAVTLLLERGADVNAATATGDTAAHAGVWSPAMIRLLAAHGAKLDVKNKQGRTPLQAALAARQSNPDAVALLRQLTGDTTTEAPARSANEQ
jgi:ankyrin